MTIKTFIEKAIEGGWLTGYEPFNLQPAFNSNSFEPVAGGEWNKKTLRPLRKQLTNAEILLDPEAWKAVGKVEGWDRIIDYEFEEKEVFLYEGQEQKYDHRAGQMLQWKYNMHRMIDSLADGQSIEDFLQTL